LILSPYRITKTLFTELLRNKKVDAGRRDAVRKSTPKIT